MAILIVCEKPPLGTSFDKWKVYRSATLTGTYSLLTTQALTDLTYQDNAGASTSWYKVSYYDSTGATLESDKSDPFQGDTTTYTSVEKVRSFLQLPTISDSTNPSTQEIVELIGRAEDEIDTRTKHAWRLRFSKTQSGQEQTAQYELHDVDFDYQYHTGIPIYLDHRLIRTLDVSQGDSLQFFNGSAWEEWLGVRTEGREADYWVDYDHGILYIRSQWYTRKRVGIRIKYRYGEISVNRMIEDAATKMVASDILTGMDQRRVMSVEGQTVSLNNEKRIEIWQRKVDETLQRLAEIGLPALGR